MTAVPGRVLITGGRGAIGRAVAAALPDATVTDIEDLDVTDPAFTATVIGRYRPDVVLHLAAAKHAPEGELDPEVTSAVNVTGTRNVLAAAATVGARVVTASTCKACDPETVYGATKLIAERMTLNAGGSVARFFNVRESSGNVFETWAGLPGDAPLPVAPCWRYFITVADAVALVLRAAVLPPGRYMTDPGDPWYMPSVAAAEYPGRAQTLISPRRGDRIREPLHAASEHAERVADHDRLLRVLSPHDPAALLPSVFAL